MLLRNHSRRKPTLWPRGPGRCAATAALGSVVVVLLLAACAPPALPEAASAHETRQETTTTTEPTFVPPPTVSLEKPTTTAVEAPTESGEVPAADGKAVDAAEEAVAGGAPSTTAGSASASPPSPVRYRVHCPSGVVHVVETRPSDAEMREQCGMGAPEVASARHGGGESGTTAPEPSADDAGDVAAPAETQPAPTTTQVAALPRMVDVRWLTADGEPIRGCVRPPSEEWREMHPGENWCTPGPVSYQWVATYNTGESVSGVTTALEVGDVWEHSPNGWHGTLRVRRYEFGSSFSANW